MAAEQLSVELVAEFVGRDAFEALKREVAQIKNSMNGLGQVQDQVRKQTDAAAGAVRQQRQAFAQTGMQINQFAGQVAAGTPIMTAFVQQIGDVAYVMGQAGQSGGKLAAFLQGPMAAALLVGISILGPLIAKWSEARDVLADTAVTGKETESAIKDYYNVIGYKEPVEKAIEAGRRHIKMLIEQRQRSLEGAQAELQRLNVIAKSNLSVVRSEDNIFRRILGDNPAEQAAKAKKVVTDLQKEINQFKDALAKPIKSPKVETPKVDTRKFQSSVERQVEQVKTIDDLLGDIQNGSAIFARQFSKDMETVARDIEKSGLASLNDNLTQAIEGVKPAIEQMQVPIDRVKSMSESMGQAFSDGIKGMITGAMSFKQAMGNVIDSVINKLFEMFIVQQITGMIAKGISSITGITLPGKAIGGPVQAGKPYVVGERGPEMFVPSRSGSIVPNNKMGNGMVINVDARGASDPAAVRMQVEQGIAQAAPYIIAAAQNRTLKTASRPRLPGTIG